MRRHVLWRKGLALGLVTVMTGMMITGCGGASGKGKSGKVDSINLMVWDGTWSEEEFDDFEEETGIHVNVSYIDNTDTLISKLIEGSVEYDLVDIEAAYVKSFVENDLLQKLDTEKLAYRKDMIESAVGCEGDKEMEYTTPDIAPGYTCVIYNKETCPIKITSFKDLADPKLEGQVAMINSTISLYGMALEALGYEANTTKESEIAEANDLLLDIKKNVKAFVGESAVSQLENGECSVAFCWDYSTLCVDAKENWEKFAVADLDTPNERFLQYWGIPKDSEKAEAATEFINFVMQPEELAKSYKEYGGAPLLKEEVMKPYLPEDYYDSPFISKYEELFGNSWMVPVDDDQIDIMDTYYTQLMGDA